MGELRWHHVGFRPTVPGVEKHIRCYIMSKTVLYILTGQLHTGGETIHALRYTASYIPAVTTEKAQSGVRCAHHCAPGQIGTCKKVIRI
jgi:hypothetical protein